MRKSIEEFYNKIYGLNYKTLSIVLILLGIVIRLYHFFLNRSLWLDEATLSNNIVSRNYLQLLMPLDDKQIAPIGFIFIQKFLISIFGVNEYALRALPVLAGILSIILFYYLLKRVGGEKVAFVGLLFFITGKYLNFHSTEAKQYSLDVFCFLLAFYYLYFRNTDYASYKGVVIKGLIGAIIIWISHCSIIFLASIGFAIAIEILYFRKKNAIPGFIIMCAVWIISFGLNYIFFLFDHASQSIQESSFVSAGFLPPQGNFKDTVLWFLPKIKESITYPIGITYYPLLLIILICLGIWHIIKAKQYKILALALPIVIHIILSLLYIYPFGGRFILYNSTFFILFIVLGLKVLSTINKWVGPPIATLLLAMAIMYPVGHAFTPIEFEEIKPSLSYIKDHMNEDDAIYIYSNSIPAFKFYQDKYFPGESEIIIGSVNTPGFDKDIKKLKNKDRVWLLFSHYDESDLNYLLEKCNGVGKIIDQYQYGGGVAVLFSTADTIEQDL